MNHSLRILTLFITFSSVSEYCSAQLVGAGKSYDFNSSHLLIPHNATQNSTTLTIEAWIKADTWATNIWENVIVSKDGWATGNQGYTLRAGANGSLSFNFGDPGGVWREVASAPQMLAGRWYHVAGTYDGTTMRIYINGVEVGSLAYSGSISSSTYDLTIGRASYTVGGNRYFDGQIDEVRMWTTALSPTTIRDFMCQKINPSHPNFGSQMAYWKLDDSGAIIDSSPNANNGTNIGAVQMTSAAPIGDQSIYDYSNPFSVTMNYGTIDSVKVTSTNSLQAIHMYRIDSPPANITAAATIDSMDYTHYYGVFPASSASYNYALTYYYAGSAMAVGNEANLNLAGRVDATIPSWSSQGATVNQPLSTVNKTYSARTELMLAIACKNINLNVSGTQSLCGTQSLNVFDQATNTNYQWHNATGPIPSETNASYTINATGSYYLVANSGMCVDTSAMINVTINPNPTVDFGTLSSTHCENDGITPILNPTPANGVYSGSGISGTDFDPSLSGVGAQTLYYSFTDGNGCSGIDSMIVDVFVQPAQPTLSNIGGVMCVSGGVAGSVYQWSLNGNSVATGTDSCYTAIANGQYSVNCTNSFGCTSEASTTTISGIGIEENVLSHGIFVSPNPTDGLITLQFEELTSELVATLRDLSGKILGVQRGASIIEFDLKNLESGVYLVSCEFNGKHVMKRVIKY